MTPRGGFPMRLSVALAATWPSRFVPMPDRGSRVNAIVAHHALRAEIRQRAAAAGGMVSPEDLARWVDSVIVYTRAVRSITALRAIREAGATTHHLHAGGTMEQTNSTAVVEDAIDLENAKLNYTLHSAVEHFTDGLEEFLRFCNQDIEHEVTAKQVGSLLQIGLRALVESTGPGKEERTVRAAAIADAFHRIGFHLNRAPGDLPGVGV
jgi:hypothetical protein